MQDWLLDLYSGEGGAGMGYARAGFSVIGVDIRPQPRYPFEFHQADARRVLAEVARGGPDWLAGRRLVAIHASPPCPRYSMATPARTRHQHPDHIAEVRDLLQAAGLPYVMENVPGAPLRPDLKLCGCALGLPPGLRRERWFELSHMVWSPPWPCRHQQRASVSIGRKGGRYNGPVRGAMENRYIPLAECQRLMGIDWMTQRGLGDAVPPAYTEYIGRRMMNARTGLPA